MLFGVRICVMREEPSLSVSGPHLHPATRCSFGLLVLFETKVKIYLLNIQSHIPLSICRKQVHLTDRWWTHHRKVFGLQLPLWNLAVGQSVSSDSCCFILSTQPVIKYCFSPFCWMVCTYMALFHQLCLIHPLAHIHTWMGEWCKLSIGSI